MRVRTVLVGVCFLSVPACTLFVSLDDLAGNNSTDAALPEAAPSDVSADESSLGADATVDAKTDDAGRPSFFPNGSFEEPGSDCNLTWARSSVTATLDTDAHDGRSACKVCSTAGGVITAYQYFPTFKGAAAGETYEVRAWVKAVSGVQQLETRIRYWNEPPSGEVFLSQGVGGARSVDTSWQELVAQAKTDVSADRIDPYFLSFPSAAGACYIIDDIRLYRIAP